MPRTDTYPAGTLIDGRYRIERKLGHGGFATVYQAEHIQLGRRAAIKVLEPVGSHRNDTYSAQFRARFNDEARIAANLDHPNVVRIFDFGFIEDERPYIAMELLDGVDLEEQLRLGPLEPERAKRLFLPVLDALRVGHERGIVHKDLKPANLFLVKAGTPEEKLIILDYGIARQESDANPRHTEEGTYTGTPAYMPPEYIHRREVIPANDVYQIGLIMTEALTGQPVVQANSQLAYMVAHVNGQRQLPEKFGETELGAVLLQALEIEPTNRFTDAGEMLRALRGARVETGADFTLHSVPAVAQLADGETEREAPPSKRPAKKLNPLLPVILAVLLGVGTVGTCIFGALMYTWWDAYEEEYYDDSYWSPEAQLPPAVPTAPMMFDMHAAMSEVDEMYSWLLARHLIGSVLFQVEAYEKQPQIATWSSPVQFVPVSIEDLMSVAWQQLELGLSAAPARQKLEAQVASLSPQLETLQQALLALHDYHTVRRGWEQDNGAQGVALTRQIRAAHAQLRPTYERWSALIDEELTLTLTRAEDRFSGDPFMVLATRSVVAEAAVLRELKRAPNSAATTAALTKFDEAVAALADYTAQNRSTLTKRFSMSAGLHERFVGSLRDTRQAINEVRASGEAPIPLTTLTQHHVNFGVYRSLSTM